ncbi:MAG TPA: ABC transporter substrate-binding protein [Candidatus Lustribacter sp.]|jgi:NitT/TauT family transport system substrate-binding protein|nr:ABC transporter substrate-binding protein [Candidatus Lustribacter sp.]
MSPTTITRRRAAALLFGGAALGATIAPGRTQTATPVRVAAIPLESASEVLYARDMGFFTKAGLDAQIQTMVNGTAIAAALVSAAVDIGYVTLDALAAIHAKGIPLVVIAPGGEYLSPSHTGALLVAGNSPIRQAKDLNGKIIAVVALNGVTHLSTRAWIDQNGGDSSTIKFVEIPPPSIPAALDAGRVDAAYDGEPYLEIAKKTDRVLVYGFDAIAKHYLSSMWCAAQPWAQEHPDVIGRFVAAMRETAAWANKNPAASGALFAGYTKTDPALIASMPRVLFTERLQPALMQPLIDVSAKYNGFKSFPATDLIYQPPR